jgi:site-specific recombinase
MAAIAGNVLVALPLALSVAMAVHLGRGNHLFPAAKAAVLLREVDPLAVSTLFYAAVAGIWLFVAGLVSGSVDNLMAYERVGDRVAQHPWLRPVIGARRAERIGGYLDENAGGLAGNLIFGLLLGLTPMFGIAAGLPLDIRHIAFSSANVGYALATLDFNVDMVSLVRIAAGVLLIGAINLAVSFSLALWLALRSRGVQVRSALSLIADVWRQFRVRPARFFVPGRETE